MPSVFPIYRVSRSGSIDEIGQYDHRTKRLTLARRGYPLLGVGEHETGDEDVPWVFQDMAPSGFIGARFSKWFRELNLPTRPMDWSADDVLRAVSEAGYDLSGNLVIGERSRERFDRVFRMAGRPGPLRSDFAVWCPRLAESALDESEGLSSLGGERPKFTLRLADGSAVLVKFSPPMSSPLGARWHDLLRVELHASVVLNDFGIPAIRGAIHTDSDRCYLLVDRFDRLVGGGRRGCVTWYSLAQARYGIANAAYASQVAENLRDDGVISDADLSRFSRAHAFSAAIGNNDTHLGNYAIEIDDDGETQLAPIYDVVPMVLAPRHDELPDARLRPVTRSDDETVRAMVGTLAGRIERDESISRSFAERWLALVRANL